MLAFQIDYLMGRAVAADLTRRDLPEWPPHPSRLYSALVSAYYAVGAKLEHREALLWLGSQSSVPQLTVPEATPQLPPPAYVNDTKRSERVKLLPELRARQVRHFPRVGLGEDCRVWIAWEADPGPHIEALQALTEAVPYLGHSSSPVAITVHTSAPAPILIADDAGPMRLRLPYPGRLAALEATHRQALVVAGRAPGIRPQPPLGKIQGYRMVGPTDAAPPPLRGEHAALIAFRLRGAALPLSRAVTLTDAVRAALFSALGTDIPEVISEHQPDGARSRQPHMAVIPLANVGLHPHAGGRIGGGAIVLPEVDSVTRARIEAALAQVTHLNIKGDELRVRPIPAWEAGALPIYLRPQTYLAQSRLWATVTPAVFPRHPRERAGRRTEEIAAEVCSHAGLPAPAEVAVSAVSWWLGAAMVRDTVRRPNIAAGRYMAHLRLRWDTPVQGPVIVGAGRYFGYGLCRPLQAKAEEAA